VFNLFYCHASIAVRSSLYRWGSNGWAEYFVIAWPEWRAYCAGMMNSNEVVFLFDVEMMIDEYVRPCTDALGCKALDCPLVEQSS
jgi:hypothetical protein